MKDLPKKIIITWGFDKTSGEIYLDTYLDIEGDESKLINDLKFISLRQRFQMTTMTLLHTPEGVTRQVIEDYFKFTPRQELLNKLQKGMVDLNKITRVASDSTAVEFIRSIEEDDNDNLDGD
jgi:hypothetical protein